MSQWIGVVVLAAGALVAGMLFGGRPDPPPPAVFSGPTTSDTITVHVTGEVVVPGLVTLVVGSRVADAVAAAGGVTVDASPIGLNLAASLSDGMQVVVPSASAEVVTGMVSLSSATLAELTGLPGVGPVLAQRIIDHRQVSGGFATMEDLLSVAGIGESKLAAIRDHAIP